MTERTQIPYTSDELTAIAVRALELHDIDGAVHALNLLARTDPARAEVLLNAMHTGLKLAAQRNDEARS